MKLKILSFAFLAISLFSCSSKSENKKENSSTSNSTSNKTDDETEINNEDRTNDNNTNYESSDETSSESNTDGCKFEDGTYSATVDYTNPETGYSQTYTLDVEVQDCQVVQIDFPQGGWLDEDHISAADLDEDGNASVDGEEGKTYEVHIDN